MSFCEDFSVTVLFNIQLDGFILIETKYIEFKKPDSSFIDSSGSIQCTHSCAHSSAEELLERGNEDDGLCKKNYFLFSGLIQGNVNLSFGDKSGEICNRTWY